MTAIGGREMSRAIDRSGALLGYEAGNTAPPAGSVDFIDYPFTSDAPTADRIETLKAAVSEHRPRIAVAPDIEGDMTIERAAAVGDDLHELGADTVVIVPKDVPPAAVPERFRVGLPAAEFGSGASHFITDYGETGSEGVHILGGSPTEQIELAGYGLDVQSVDGSAVETGAKMYDIWTPDAPHWAGVSGSTDLYDRVQASLNNVVGAWKLEDGQQAEITTAEDMNRAAEKRRERQERDARARHAGRGPPLADPDTGEVLTEDGDPIETGTIGVGDINRRGLSPDERELLAAVEAATTETEDDSSETDESSDDAAAKEGQTTL